VATVVAEFACVLRRGGCLLVEFQSSGSAPTHAFDHAAAPAWAWNCDEFGALLGRSGLVERARLLCAAQPDLMYAGTPEAYLIFRKSGPCLGPEPLAR
jgi:hypothetical protein